MIKPVINLKGVSGIYRFIHKESLMCYVGSSIDIRRRFMRHLRDCKNGSRTCIHEAIRKFGLDAFDFEVVERVPQEQLLEREKFWMLTFDSASVNGFNTSKEPRGTYTRTVSDVTRQRIGLANKGRKQSPEQIERTRQIHLGKPLTDAHKAAISIANTGRKASNETKARLSAARKGWKPSDEVRAKISATLKGRKLSKEHADKLAAYRRGRPLSAEHKANLSAAQKGRTVPDERIAKTSKTKWAKNPHPSIRALRKRAKREAARALKDLQPI